MPRRDNKKGKHEDRFGGIKAEIKNPGLVLEQLITKTLEINFMPYAMSVIVSRAIPEIDGFKPSHRKLLYTMYTMGLLGAQRSKSANVVGQTMKLNPHGDAAIYETLVRLSRGYAALLHPYVDSKGNFGKAYSRDMAYAASRYTECKLDPICAELFRDIDNDTVDFVDNYDNKMKEPTLLPVTFPSVLVNANTGIAVGMASNICSFNLAEVCETTIRLIKNPEHDILSTLKAPDFSGGGTILYDRNVFTEIYSTGRGSFKVRGRYTYDKANNCVEITEIPPTTTVEAIIDKIVELVKNGKIKDISDVRDETDVSGLKLTVDLKRGADPDKLMAKFYRMTPLEDSFGCNFNVLINGMPRVMGVKELLNEWTAFRAEAVRRRLNFNLKKANDKLHLLKGLEKILLDIDKAVRIVRETDEETEVVPNIMIGFGIDEIQAEYVAEIKLRHLNREYILKRTQETDNLEREIVDLKAKLADRSKILDVIVDELREVVKKYGKPRKSLILYDLPDDSVPLEEEAADYPVTLFRTREGYFKKITPQSLRMSGEQKVKEGDEVTQTIEASNNCELLFFTDLCQVYKAKVSDFDDMKASLLGEYIPAKLSFDDGENIACMAVTSDYSGYMLFFFSNGKVAKVELKSYETKQNRRKLVGAFSGKSPLVNAVKVETDREFVLCSSSGRLLIVHSGAVAAKAARDTQGVNVMTLKPGQSVVSVSDYSEGQFKNPHRYRVKTLPGAGMMPTDGDIGGEQLTFI
jgi:DNA gyrase subunit A